MKAIYELSIKVSGDAPCYGEVLAFLGQQGVAYAESVLDVTGEDDADTALLEKSILKVYFEERAECSQLQLQLEDRFKASLFCQISRLQEQSWMSAWQEVGAEVGLGDFLIRFGKPDIGSGMFSLAQARQLPIPIHLSSKDAFGTGEHVTTRLLLEALQDLQWGACSKGGRRKRFLDVGTGSGFFAIAAEKKGFAEVQATEVLPEVYQMAVENIRMNACHATVFCTDSLEQVDGTFAMIVCNILPPELFRMLQPMARRMDQDGILLLAGLNKQDSANLVIALRETHLQWTRTWMHLDWLCCELTLAVH